MIPKCIQEVNGGYGKNVIIYLNMPVYFMRHGQSTANAKGVFAGQRNNCALTESGCRHINDVAKGISKIKFDHIIRSNLRRARQTTNIIMKEFDIPRRKVSVDKRLCEYDMGTLTGTPIREIMPFELILAKKTEKPEHFRKRVISFLKKYKDTDQTLLLISHDGVYRMIEATRLGLDADQFYTLPLTPNGAVIPLDLSWLDDYEILE